jgi:hypothetical protein
VVAFNDEKNHASDKTPALSLSGRLIDFCKILEWGITDFKLPIRIESQGPCHAAYVGEYLEPDMFLEACTPVPLSELLGNHHLSARSKLSLAFTFSKSFWQYYDSDWMRARWTVDTIKVLPQHRTNIGSTLGTLCQSLFLDVNSANSIASVDDSETQRQIGNIPQLHPYPYILGLGVLLVQLCLHSSTTHPHKTSGSTNNEVFAYYYRYMRESGTDWPVLDLSEEYRVMYREIVACCLPRRRNGGWTSPLFREDLDPAGRRTLLMKHVVAPLHKLLQYMQDPHSDVSADEEAGTQDYIPVGAVMNQASETQRCVTEQSLWIMLFC